MLIEQISEPGAEWDSFVETRAGHGAAVAHASAWSGILREAYRLDTCFLQARSRSNGELRGILPLAAIRTLTGRRELVSLPFHDIAGVLAEDLAAEEALVAAAQRAMREGGFGALELRQAQPLAALLDSVRPQSRVDLVLPLEGDEAAQWKAIGAKVRNQTRKAEREGLSIAEGSPEWLLGRFYGPFCENMRDLGSPVHGRSFFAAIQRHFGDRARIVVVQDASRPVGGLVAIQCVGAVSVPWASTLRSERRRCPNNLIYWEALRWAISRGAAEFDFGRSPRDSGTYRFKRGWGAKERPLAWIRLSRKGGALELPSAADSGLLSRLSSIWSRLPVRVTGVLGPRIRRHLAN